MLAKRLPTILPDLTLSEALETTKIHSVVGLLNGKAIIATRPFRSPHHTISDAGLVGGGTVPKPGEVSLAHNGVPLQRRWIDSSAASTTRTGPRRKPLKRRLLRQGYRDFNFAVP